MAGEIESDQPKGAERRIGELIGENLLATRITMDEDDRGSVGTVVDDGDSSFPCFNKMGSGHQKFLVDVTWAIMPRRT